MNIFKLFGSVFVDTDKADKSLAKTDKKAEGLGTKFVKGAGKAAKFGAAIGGAALVGGAAIIGLGKKVGDNADRLLDMASATGMSTDEIQKWEQVATVAGVSSDAMTKASAKLTKQLDVMSEGNNKASEAAAELGFSYEDLIGMSADERMNAITEALGNVEDGTERAKLGTDLLGGAWAEVAPIIDVGAEAMQGIKDNATIMSPEQLEAANKFRISMDQMKEKALLLGQGLILKLMPTLNKMFDWIGAHMPEIEAFFTTAFDFIGEAVTVAVEVFNTYLLPVLKTIFEWIKLHMPEIKEFFKTTFENIVLFVQLAIAVFNEYLLPVLKNLFQWISDNMPAIKKVFETVFNAIVAVVKVAWAIFTDVLLPILKTIFNWVIDNWPAIQKTFEVVFEVIATVVGLAIEGFNKILTVFTAVFNFVKDTFSGIGELIKTAFGGVVDFIGGIIDKFVAIKDAIGGAIDKVKEFVSADSAADYTPTNPDDDYGPSPPPQGTGYYGAARGGTTLTSGMVTVGEQGKENVFLPKGARVQPMDRSESGGININIQADNIIGQNAGEELGDLLTDYLRGQGVIA